MKMPTILAEISSSQENKSFRLIIESADGLGCLRFFLFSAIPTPHVSSANTEIAILSVFCEWHIFR